MSRRRRNSGPAPWTGVLLLCLFGGGLCLLHQVRLDRKGRSVIADGVEIGRSGKGRPVCDYSYVVEGKTYVNRNLCVGLPQAQIDYLPTDPLESRLHAEKGEGWAGVWGFGFFGVVATAGLVTSLIENPKFWRF